ncbi:hypothetical protein [Microbulbifer hainanensis]|uniref:hypothetical protein n=1 Tax=Microbulbifer hainanensis TaxID=2735675 RepID=UPI0018680315|nr:hypothetical protein [Microbulbifer hainanensis]
MNNQIIYIEDQEDARKTFSNTLKRIYGLEYEIVTPIPCAEILEMREKLFNFESPAAFVLDEKLQFTGETKYSGSDLAKAIREIDSKIPVYILTSYAGDVDPLSGEIEFVIDKTIAGDPDRRKMLAQRMRRHQETFNDIKTNRANRFNYLLAKSINESLSAEELAEYEELNILRVKNALLNEQIPTQELESQIEQQNKLLNEIHEELKILKDKN